MAQIRAAVRENRLSDPASIAPADYEPYIAGHCCWVGEADGAILGFAALDAAAASVWAFFVAPDAEGRGAGRLLLAALIAEARRRGLLELSLSTDPGTRAERLYRSAGWTAAGHAEGGTLALRLIL